VAYWLRCHAAISGRPLLCNSCYRRRRGRQWQHFHRLSLSTVIRNSIRKLENVEMMGAFLPLLSLSCMLHCATKSVTILASSGPRVDWGHMTRSRYLPMSQQINYQLLLWRFASRFHLQAAMSWKTKVISLSNAHSTEGPHAVGLHRTMNRLIQLGEL